LKIFIIIKLKLFLGMVVRSRTVEITVYEVEYSLSIDVWPLSGKVGDTFIFSGALMKDSTPVAYEQINLVLEGYGVVASTRTKSDGHWELSWIADRAGTLRFHAEAPYVSASSSTVSISVSGEGAEGVRFPALGFGLVVAGLIMIAISRWMG